MTGGAPPARSGTLTGVGRTIGSGAVGGTMAFVGLVVVCQVLAGVQFLLVGAFELWSWAKSGLFTALLSVRADAIATVQGPPLTRAATPSTLHVRFVPMLLTIGFLWLASRVGRRAARARSDRPPSLGAALAAAGAGVSVAVLAALCAIVVTLSVPALGLRLRVDVGSAALWAGLVAAAGAGTGAYLEAARGRVTGLVLTAGLAAYGWALALLAVGVFVLATFEPTVTRSYVDGVTGLGAPGSVLVGSHLLAFPAQSALLLAPASGSCLEIVGGGSMLQLCPWRLVASGPAGEAFLAEPLPLSSWLWLLSVAPLVATISGGRRAASGATGRRAAGLGVAAGSTFALLALVGAWFAAPELIGMVDPSSALVPARVSIHPEWVRTAVATTIWGVAGGALGAWLATRGYEGPELPRPTSA